MANKIIPWRDLPDFTQTLKLGGTIYKLRARWNTVAEFWTLDICDTNGDPLILGLKIVFNVDFLERNKNELLPEGSIFAVNTGNDLDENRRIGRKDIGVNVLIVYREA